MDDNDVMKSLIAELNLLDQWDAEYSRETEHNICAIEAFEQRQMRKKEVLTEIIFLQEMLSQRAS